ncbi:MAG: HAD hydrolase-like protein [Acidobacteriota bacterium]
MSIKAVIFDYSTLLLDKNRVEIIDKLRALIQSLRNLGIKIVVFSTHPKNINTALSFYNLPPVDLFLCRKDIGISKGSHRWIDIAGSRLRFRNNDFLYIGDDKLDWRTAINAATLFLHAEWAKPLSSQVTPYSFQDPADIWQFISHFLLTPPRWEYKLDLSDHNVCIRSLLEATVELPATKPISFRLQDIFTYHNTVSINNYSARDILMLHAITSLYLEGLIYPNSLFVIYPSSTPGKINDVIEEFLHPVSKIFHGYYKNDLLCRTVQAPDTSIERWQAKQENRQPNVSFINQSNTVHINPYYRGKITGKSVIVIDDFTTTGMSLEWAKNLLLAAGADNIVLLTIGKYPRDHTIYSPINIPIDPFKLTTYSLHDFQKISQPLEREPSAQQVIYKSFSYWKDGKPLPIS